MCIKNGIYKHNHFISQADTLEQQESKLTVSFVDRT